MPVMSKISCAATGAAALMAASAFVAPSTQTRQPTLRGAAPVEQKSGSTLGAAGAASVAGLVAMSAMASRPSRSSVVRCAYDASKEIGACDPLLFWDPIGYCGGDCTKEDFDRRRAVELKHGRICMFATIGMLWPDVRRPWKNAQRSGFYLTWFGKFDGYLSPSQNLTKFADVPSGIAAISKEALQQKATSAELIDAINSAQSGTWRAGENLRFAGATLKDAKILMGSLQDVENSTRLPYKPLDKVVDLPEEFDWRTDARAKNCPSLKEIRDQADCGSCWAFGSVEAMTDRICIASKGQKQIHLSAEDVTSCDTMGDMGCNGGIPSTVYSYYKTFGIVDGGNYGDKSMCYSYQLKPCAHHSTSAKYPNCTGSEATPRCARKCIDNGADWRGSKHYGTGGYSVCQQGDSKCSEAMMQEIYQNGPITGMFFVHQSFLSYKSGVYKAGLFFKDPMLGGHAIKIMGWGTENGTPYWLVANSWNGDWGDHGYFKIERGTNQCQIENPIINGGPVAGLPKLSTVEEMVV